MIIMYGLINYVMIQHPRPSDDVTFGFSLIFVC
jgi:hypothetical protein